jgi:plasmid replication initiation protein
MCAGVMYPMEKKRKADYGEDNKVTVRNDFVKADYPSQMTATDLKLLRLVIAQCRKSDTEFYEYQFSAVDIAEKFGMDKSNLYREAQKSVRRLFKCDLEVGTSEEYELLHIFKTAKYKSGVFTMQLSEEVEKLFLRLKRDFTNIPLLPVLAMKNKNSIRIYEVICQKFMSHYPYADQAMVVNISLEELKEITETKGKKSYEHTGHLKDKILTPAIEEIEAAANWKIIVKNLKLSRRIIGYELTVWDRNGYDIMEECKRTGTLPPRPKYKSGEKLGQLSLFDVL